MDWRYFAALTVLLASLAAFSRGQEWQPKADVVFVLDSSDTVGAERWGELKTMLLRLVQTWNIGSNGIQVSAVSYGSGPKSEFYFNDVTNGQQLAQRLETMTFSGGTPDAGEAIRFAYRTSFSATYGARSGVPHVIVHVSNGPSSDLDLLLQEAKNARDQGISIFNIGIGQGIETDRLEQIASDPSSRYAFRVDSYSSLLSLVPTLSSRIINAVPVNKVELPTVQGCLAKADLVLLVDSSSSVGQEDFEHLEDFLKDLVMQLPVAPDQVQIGLVQFSSHPSLEFPLNMNPDRLSALKAIDTVQFMGGGTNTGEAIEYTTKNVFSTQGGARIDVPRILMVVTDGNSMDGARTLAAANQARQNNIGVIAVGVGSSINSEELSNIGQDPHNVFQIGSYKDLQTLTTTILNSACRVEARLTTTAPGVTAAPCVDVDSDCSSYADSVCTSYTSWAQQHCARRCGFCHGEKVEVPCVNKVNNCESYGSDVCTGTYHDWAMENCPRFCGFCGADSATLGFYNKCMYKGRQYVQNEKWVDGCDYECVCEDSSTGFYRCYNRCPVYYDLPSSCTLVGVPGECCLKPVCDFRQELSVQEVAPGRKVNAQGIEVCEYQGLQYYQDQTWDVGCDFRCTCVDTSRGFYRCQSYCPTYPALPSMCRLTQKAGQCCMEPVCEFNTQTGSFTGYGTISGRGVETRPQGGETCQDVLVDCAHYGVDACTQYTSWARNNCAKFCGFCSLDTVAPGADDFCYYNGKKYSQGQKWDIDCDTQCTCEKAVYGYYRCVQRCAVYLNLPAGCSTVKKVGECCQSVECEQGTYYSSATNIFTIGSGGGLYVRSGGNYIEAVPTLPSGATLAPGTAIGSSTGLQNIRIDGCLFHGRVYIQQQQWNEGCDFTCVCLDAGSGRFACRERCPKYDSLPAGCTYVPDPNDPCCTIPSCPASVNYVMIPVYSKSVQAIGAVMAPGLFALMSGTYTSQFTLRHSAFTVAPPTQPVDTLKPGGLDYCEYKGQHYSHGQTWEDGCDYNCVCEDAFTGSWRCVDKCEHYINVQPPCYLEQDPVQTCCQRPVCNFEIIHNEFQGNNTLPTTTTTTQRYGQPACSYKGTQYLQGQSWFDGCDLKCRCDSADNNVYSCLSRCPSYPENYRECPQVPDPSDPGCCLVPVCTPTSATTLIPPTGVTLVPHPFPVLPPGIVSGGGNTIGYCLYNGVHYSQDQRWQDGCQYNCVCTDASIGHYSCTKRCPRYAELPPTCRLITDFSDPCCQVPTCDGQYNTFTGSCHLASQRSQLLHHHTVLYNGARFYQGQTWQDGCSKTCRCEDAANQIYTCTDRCPVFEDLPSECRLSADSSDPCCLSPICTPTPGLVPTLFLSLD
ncbi:uncharacterized protein LOC112577005 [Pomacea canaliculata]|uniref:uncharacterized protein LOC112577005 n=1 Tax=Pomacea canaliculata TaxID=400727 RepID=UPI000D734E7D|nr:uncharacterized protein LOC112577005 [Pomacea canaliculata]